MNGAEQILERLQAVDANVDDVRRMMGGGGVVGRLCDALEELSLAVRQLVAAVDAERAT